MAYNDTLAEKQDLKCNDFIITNISQPIDYFNKKSSTIELFNMYCFMLLYCPYSEYGAVLFFEAVNE